MYVRSRRVQIGSDRYRLPSHWLALLLLGTTVALAAVMMPTSQSRVARAQPPTATPTATAEATGENEVYRWDILNVGSDNVVKLEGNWANLELPCIKDISFTLNISRHVVGLKGTKSSAMHKVEIGVMKANLSPDGRPKLYTYCSFCTKPGPIPGTQVSDPYHREMDANGLMSTSQFRIEVTNTSVQWFFNNGGAGEVRLRNFTSESIGFHVDDIYVGGQSTDTRNDLGVHLTENVQYKIGIGAWTYMAPIPSQYLAGRFTASGTARYYTSWLPSSHRQWLFSDVHIGRGVSLCP